MVYQLCAMEGMGMSFENVDSNFWKSKKVFLTGHTGFKGGWLSYWLNAMGAEVTGYALPPNTSPNLFDLLNINDLIRQSYIADIGNLTQLSQAVKDASPDVLIHMAAQPLVRYSYANPIETYATNVMGTAHVLEAARAVESLRATVVVTTDKCYKNKEWLWGYREADQIGGRDPYSSSKGCAELVTQAYRESFFLTGFNAVASVRAGNVIGGGDWSEDRLIPDAIKAMETNQSLQIRNPNATRPWQHVLEPLSGYLILAQKLYGVGQQYAGAWNFGPNDEDVRSVAEVVSLLASKNEEFSWDFDRGVHHHEANLLKLDCSKARSLLNWTPRWNLEIAIEKIMEWHQVFRESGDVRQVTLNQISDFMSASK